MKNPLIASCAAASLLFAACEQKPAQISFASTTPSPSSGEVVREPYTPATSSSSSSTETVVTPGTAPSPFASTSSKGELVFKSEAATQAASEYLNGYNTMLNDINARPATRDTDPETGLNNARAQLQNLARDMNQLGNQQKQVQQQLTPDEIKRLLQYRKNLEKGSSQNNSGL